MSRARTAVSRLSLVDCRLLLLLPSTGIPVGICTAFLVRYRCTEPELRLERHRGPRISQSRDAMCSGPLPMAFAMAASSAVSMAAPPV